jgi:hypothetical protein
VAEPDFEPDPKAIAIGMLETAIKTIEKVNTLAVVKALHPHLSGLALDTVAEQVDLYLDRAVIKVNFKRVPKSGSVPSLSKEDHE